jgi:hypothetical protein
MTKLRAAALASILAALPLFAGCASGGDPLSPPSTGGMALVVSGLPASTNASVAVSGPGGFSQSVTGSTNLDNLTPGAYALTSVSVTVGADTYVPAPATQTVIVPASPSRVAAAVTYGLETGRLIVTVNGLPAGTDASITVSNAVGFSQAVTATDTLEGLAAGSYTVTASNVSSGPVNYAASPQSQQVQVQSAATGSSTVTYSVFVPGSVNLAIDGMYLTQAVQSYSDTVPLVASRDAYLRVFVRADQINAMAPTVRVRLYDGANPTPIQTYTINAPGTTTPTSVNEGSLSSSWNQLIPGTLIQPNLRILADVDPSGAYAESNETDNSLPLSGAPKAETVRVVNPIAIRLVPVVVAGATGNVTGANMNQFLVTMRKVLPLRAVNPEVRSQPYTSSAPALVSDNSNGAWGTVLSEISALRTADGYSGYYYGVVQTSYSSGVAGIGYVPGQAAVGWDRLPSGDEVMAHEFGHNLSLGHAPCGSVSSPDPAFPYTQGAIGVYGLDVGSLTLKAPSSKDLMGYCSGTQWISDYHYLKAFNYRNANPQAVMMDAPAEGLLVWGRIVNGVVELEPSFSVAAPAQVSSGGRLLLEGLDASGRVLFRHRFDGEVVADQDGDHRQFAFVIPLAAATRERLARLRVQGGVQGVERSSQAALAAGAGGRVLTIDLPATGRQAAPVGNTLRLRWNASAYPMALVRDAATGDILSFARGGDATIATTQREVDITWSDGVQSLKERIRIP